MTRPEQRLLPLSLIFVVGAIALCMASFGFGMLFMLDVVVCR